MNIQCCFVNTEQEPTKISHKIRRKSWQKDRYVYLGEFQPRVTHGFLSIEDYRASDWEYYAPKLYIRDLKVGEKFILMHFPKHIYQIVTSNFIPSTGNIWYIQVDGNGYIFTTTDKDDSEIERVK